MHLTTKLILILPLQFGTGKNGEWKKQDIIVETNSQHPVFPFGVIKSTKAN